MQKTINLDGRDVRVQMSADTLRSYRKQFGRDLLRDMLSLQDDLDMEVIENLFYIAASACEDLPPIEEWLQQFSPFAMYNAAPELMKIWREENTTTTERKKKADQ